MKLHVPFALQELAKRIPSLYVVGGYVRNAVWRGDIAGTDVDVCGPLTPDEVRSVLRDTHYLVLDVNPRIGTVLIKTPDGEYEYTTFRYDSYPIGGAHTPAEVRFVRTIEEDAGRRDFRMNAIYLSAATGEVVDPTGGVADLANRLVRTTRAPSLVFGEDGLRILRLVRFACEMGFAPDAETFKIARNMRRQLEDISTERKTAEMERIMLSDTRYGEENAPVKGLQLLQALGCFPLLGLPDKEADLSACGRLPAVLSWRLVALLRALGVEDIRCLVGKGMRFPNHLVKEVSRLLGATRAPDEKQPWLWMVEHAADIEAACIIWRAEGNGAYADLVEGEQALLKEKGVPWNYHGLPVTPEQIKEILPPHFVGEALTYLVVEGARRRVALSDEQCLLALAEFKELKKC